MVSLALWANCRPLGLLGGFRPFPTRSFPFPRVRVPGNAARTTDFLVTALGQRLIGDGIMTMNLDAYCSLRQPIWEEESRSAIKRWPVNVLMVAMAPGGKRSRYFYFLPYTFPYHVKLFHEHMFLTSLGEWRGY